MAAVAAKKKSGRNPFARKLRTAPFALRIVRRAGGDAAIIYRRKAVPGATRASRTAPERLVSVASLAPLPYGVAIPLARAALRASLETSAPPRLQPGPALPLDHDWGVRLACFARIASGLRDVDRLSRAAAALQNASGAEAAWWLGLMDREDGARAVRALRILTEATV
ncbi:MAG: hypothetical protein LC118_10355 [Dehalococcoidia bacterium]|nr:hypothetical protein [Dehalococcoidia bacterium]